jgi:hypothetical protein
MTEAGSNFEPVGNLKIDDEMMHPIDDHPQFNESALLTMFDREAGAGGFLRIGNRPNEKHAESTFCWFLPDGSALFAFDRAEIASNDRFRTDQISVEVTEPGHQLRASFRGQAHHLDSAKRLIDPKAALSGSTKVATTLDLSLVGVSPLYGGRPFPGLDTGGHYEQHMRVTGAIVVNGSATNIVALGNRDHSWGPRVWQATHADRTLWCTFGDNFGIATSLTWHSRRPDEYVAMGYVWRHGEMRRVIDASVRSRFEDAAHLFHTDFNARLHLEDGSSLVVDGKALQIAPLRHRRGGETTHIGWAMSEFTCDGRKGLGLSEYLDLA